MPTPSPISDASCDAKSGVSTTWLSSVMIPSDVPSARSVAIRGRPAATSEPNVISRTIAAARTPKNSDGPWLLLKRTISAPGPPCSTCSCALRAVNAAFSTFSSVSGVMSFVLVS
jgi:hypothetical protein